MKNRIALFAAAISILVAAGCPNDPASEDGGASGASDGGNTAGDAGSLPNDAGDSEDSDGGGEEIDTTRDPECTDGNWVVQLQGSIDDEAGGDIGDAKIQICVRTSPSGAFLCLQPGTTNTDGTFATTFPEAARCVDKATARAFVPIADRTTSYCPVDLSVDEPILHLASPYVLFATALPTTLPTLGAGDAIHTLVYEDGLEIDVRPDQFGIGYEDVYPTLAAVKVEAANPGVCTDATENIDFVGFYGFSPERNVGGEPFRIRIPTDGLGLTGSTADLYALGGLTCKTEDDEIIEEGKWEKVASGTVSSDGQYLESDGLHCFTFLGIANPE
jgi:hypothetical protein